MYPVIPARQITRIGCHLTKYTNMNADRHIATLFITSADSEPKFAEFISRRAAEAINPTTTGRSPAKMPFITALSLCRCMKWEAYRVRINDGTTTTSVHVSDPSNPHSGPAKAGSDTPGATYPIYVAELIPIARPDYSSFY